MYCWFCKNRKVNSDGFIDGCSQSIDMDFTSLENKQCSKFHMEKDNEND